MRTSGKFYYIFTLILLGFYSCAVTVKNKSVDNLIENTFQLLRITSNTTTTVPLQQEKMQHICNTNLQYQWVNESGASKNCNNIQKQELLTQRLSNVIASNILNFGLNLANQLNDISNTNEGIDSEKSQVFSPLSIISALTLLLLGAKGQSYQQLRALIGLCNDNELLNNRSQYHWELALMLDDVQKQQKEEEQLLHWTKRKPPNCRFAGNFNMNKKKVNQPLPSVPVINTHLQYPTSHNINIANGIFIQTGYTLNLNYKQVIAMLYNTEVTELDYAQNSQGARIHINNWVKQKTQGKIPNIITGQIDQRTNILLVSVLYFKAFWENTFFPKATKMENFYPDGLHNAPVQVQMMATGGIFPFHYSQKYDCRIIGLPYKGNEVTMYILQPNNSTRIKLKELEKNLNAQIINDMIEKMVWKTTVMVLPKMHFTRQLNLKDILGRLGLRDIFIKGTSDFSLIGIMRNYSSSNVRRRFPTDDLHTSINTTEYLDRFNEPALIFRNRLNSDNVTMAALTTKTYEKTLALNLLENERSAYNTNLYHSDLFVEDILHKIDIEVNEQGTEASATTLTYLHRSGTDVVFRGDTPFLLLIQHDSTKLPLFYGSIYKHKIYIYRVFRSDHYVYIFLDSFGL